MVVTLVKANAKICIYDTEYSAQHPMYIRCMRGTNPTSSETANCVYIYAPEVLYICNLEYPLHIPKSREKKIIKDNKPLYNRKIPISVFT